jgi:Ca2+-binding RTX toxin-like protein
VTHHRGGAGRFAVVVGAVVIALFAPGSALASTAIVNGSTLFIKGAPGEQNVVEVGYDAKLFSSPVLVVTDVPGPTAGNGCQDFAQTAICSAAAIHRIQIETNDGNDTILIDDQVPKIPTRIYGGSGNDQIRGSRGNDWFDGGTGADSITGKGGIDTVAYKDRSTPVVIHLGQPSASGNADDGPLGSRDSISDDVENARGGSGADRIFGTRFDNKLSGGIGNDVVRAGRGRDILRGGIDNDTLSGGANRDLLKGGLGADFLRGGNGRDKELGSLGADRLRGGTGGDKLKAGPGDDTVNGLPGNDWIWGGLGSDALLGQQGIDHIFAADGDIELKINCGPGNNRRETATWDKRDRTPRSC